jgi:hypothetical protein
LLSPVRLRRTGTTPKHIDISSFSKYVGYVILLYNVNEENMNNLGSEIIKIAKSVAERFIYYKSKNPNAGNYFVGENEIEGQCSDYALLFVIEWNKRYPKNTAEIVTVNQEKGIKSGSYKVVEKLTDEEPIALGIKYYNRNMSQWFIPPVKTGSTEISVLFHPKMGFYKLVQSKNYDIIQHFGVDMINKAPHTWAKVGDIAVDPCWADTDNTPFIGKDIITY